MHPPANQWFTYGTVVRSRVPVNLTDLRSHGITWQKAAVKRIDDEQAPEPTACEQAGDQQGCYPGFPSPRFEVFAHVSGVLKSIVRFGAGCFEKESRHDRNIIATITNQSGSTSKRITLANAIEITVRDGARKTEKPLTLDS